MAAHTFAKGLSFFDKNRVARFELTGRISTERTSTKDATGSLPPEISTQESKFEKEEFHCLKTGRCILPPDRDDFGEIEPFRAIVGDDYVQLTFDKYGKELLNEDVLIEDIEYETDDGQHDSIKKLQEKIYELKPASNFAFNFDNIPQTSLSKNTRLENAAREQSKLSPLSTRYVYKFPFYHFPCWIRYIRIRIWNRWYRFPVLGWSRRCCGRTSGTGSYYSDATGCHSGTGPFLSEAQCEYICGPFEPPAGQDCVFGDVTYAHGQEVSGCAGTTCSCDDGVFTCDDCRWRREIHDVHGNTANPSVTTAEEQQIVDSLRWVSDGCEINSVKQCDGWLLDMLEDHMTYGSVAHGNSQFFPWHRAYLKALETKMQLYHPCVTLPWWDWTQDQDSGDDSQFGWVEGTAEGNYQGVWGFINGDQNQMGNFTNTGSASAPAWTLPPSFGNLARGSSVSSISNLPTTTTLAGYLARASFGTSPAFKSFEGPHGGPHVMIGGQMGNFRSPADPIFWLHHAAVDKLWYDWQALHLPGTDYDANPSTLMPPFDVAPEDVFDSRNDLGVCYEPWSGIATSSRRRLSHTTSSNCPDVYNPVCCNGHTYSNPCFAEGHCRSYKSGQCGQCICTKEYVPVCCNGRTYSNRCMARCEEKCKEPGQITDGKCRITGDRTTADRATAIEYGLIAAFSDISLRKNLAAALQNENVLQDAASRVQDASVGSCENICETGCEFCVDVGFGVLECRDDWATGMFMDPVELRKNACIDQNFKDLTNAATDKSNIINDFKLDTLPSKCDVVRCPANSVCVETGDNAVCKCDKTFIKRKGKCEPMKITDLLDDSAEECLATLTSAECLKIKTAWKEYGCADTCSARL